MTSRRMPRLSAMVLVGLLGACATGGSGTSNWLTVFVDNMEGQAVVVSTGYEDGCQVDARATRHACRYPWTTQADLELQVFNPSRGATHAAQSELVSPGDRLCLVVRTNAVQLRGC